jgi:uncharacterized protein
MHIGILTIHFRLDSCHSLKEKRSQIKPFQERVRKQFNFSVAEVDRQDSHQNAVIAFGMLNNNTAVIDASFSQVVEWIETNFPELLIQDQKMEML